MNHIRDEFFEKVLYCIEYERTVEVTAEHSKVDLTQIQVGACVVCLVLWCLLVWGGGAGK